MDVILADGDVLRATGLPCIGLAGQGAQGHDGGHIWGCYAEGVEPAAVRLLLPTCTLVQRGPGVQLYSRVLGEYGGFDELLVSGLPACYETTNS
jgi:hypothetical protein